MRSPCAAGFTLVEMLVALLVVAILTVLMLGGVERSVSAANAVKCVGNLRQIGVAVAAYAGENNNQWPFYKEYKPGVDEQAYVGRLVREGSTWMGLGKTYPYLLEKRIFCCPADKYGTVKALTVADWGPTANGSIQGTYSIRGLGQVKPRPLGATLASLGRRSIASCQWAYATSNPMKLPLAFHSGGYPVLFSDGSVERISFPAGSVDSENPPNINNSTSLQRNVWEFFDGKLTTELQLK